MTTFNTFAAQNSGVGVAYLLEGSLDAFATVTWSYSTHDGRFGGSVDFDPRIVGVGDLQRGFGVDGIMAASSFTIRLGNADGGADFLLQASPSTPYIFKARWRLTCVLYDTSNPSDFATKVLGVYVNLDNPMRDGISVVLQLADDAFGQAAELAIPPTWTEAYTSTLDPASSEPPVPIALGGGTIPAVATPFVITDTTVRYVLTATVDTAAVVATELDSITIRGSGNYGGSPLLDLPPGGVALGKVMPLTNTTGGGQTLVPLWDIAKTASITKDGKTWKVLYLNLYVQNLRDWLYGTSRLGTVTGTTPVAVQIKPNMDIFNTYVVPTLQVEASGPKFASITYTTNGSITTVRAPDIAYDLLRYYSRGLTSAQVDQASFTAATAAAPMYYFRAAVYFSNFLAPVDTVSNGSIFGRATRSGFAANQGLLRKALTDLCQGGFFDIVTSWAGVFTAFVLANNFTLQTVTPTTVDETLMDNISDKVPSSGERWAPYNRVIFASSGRVVDNNTAISDWGTVLPRTINDSVVNIEVAFSGTDFGIGTFGGIGLLESTVRPIITFDYPLEALNWELGDFIAVTWSRGASGLAAYGGTVFRVEALTLHPERCSMTVRAVFLDDLRQALPYLLDDETLLVRSKGALTGSATVENSNPVVVFGGTINFTTMGVLAGDILILRDSTQAADVFSRNRVLRIGSVDAINEITVDDADLNFDGTSTAVVANADWSIVRGATTYPTAVSDPTNYPSGGSMYGKQSESGAFSDSLPANLLQAG